MIIAPVAIPDASQPLPDPNDLSTWAARMAEMHRWMRENVRPGVNAQSSAAYENALDAKASAEAAAALSGATVWSALTNYSAGVAAISPTTWKAYIRKSPGGVNATDPASAPTLWEPTILTRVSGGMLEYWDTTQWIPVGWKRMLEGISLTGTAYDLTALPSWVNGLRIPYVSVSSAANDVFGVQLGHSGGFVATGYEGAAWGSGGSNLIGTARYTAGAYVTNGQASTFVMQGTIEIERHSGNLWQINATGQVEGVATLFGSRSKVTLPAALDRIRLHHSASGAADGGVFSVFARN